MSRATVLLMALALLSEMNIHELATDVGPYLSVKDISKLQRYIDAREYKRHIDSMISVHRGAAGGQMYFKTLMNTKYRTWKRNADVINSLLALPKGMTAAGR